MSKLKYVELQSRTNEFVALTGLPVDEFELLVPPFEKAFQAHMSEWCVNGQKRRQRRYTTYENCPLATAADRLLFVTSYLKGNPIQSVHGTMFGMVQSKVNLWLHVLLPVLGATFRELGLAPSRSVSELAEQLDITLEFEGGVRADSEAALPLFAMTAQNEESSVPKLRQNRVRAIAARNIRTPSRIYC
jgi:hypothetical protein